MTMTAARSFLPLLLLILLASCASAWVLPCAPLKRSSSSLFVASPAQYSLDGETIRGPVTPLGNYLLVKTKDTLTATDGGILLPDQAKERPTEGVVLAAGPGRIHPDTAVRMTNPVSEGDSVLFGKYDGQPIVYNEEQCQMIRDDNVMLYYEGVSMTFDNVNPCRDFVLVELDQEEKLTTSSGIAIAAQVTKEDLPCEGIVAKLGEGKMTSTGEIIKPPLVVGERVKFKDYAGNDVMIQGKPFSLVRTTDILCSMPQKEGDKEE